jgi:predicted O-methyltransferase YrrM
MTGEQKYINDYSTPQGEVLEWLEKQTHLRTNHARMLSGRIQGKLLKTISQMIKPDAILELGTFTGYSAICLSAGLSEEGIIDTIEINDELEDLIIEGFKRAGIENKVRLHIGDAKKIVTTLNRKYDLVYIDANKREYVEYFDLVIDKVRKGGFIIADNVLWDGKVYDENPHNDAQTHGIMIFNEYIYNNPRVENFILPVRDGINIIRVK